MLGARQRSDRGEGGFTLLELVVAMALTGVLLALAVPTWGRYSAGQDRVSASREVVSVLRAAQLRATAEEATYRVDVDQAARTLRVHRFDGAGYALWAVRPLTGSAVRLEQAGFRDSLGATTTSAYFYPRGTASPGRVVVRHEGQAAQHVITVEGLTGRVSTT